MRRYLFIFLLFLIIPSVMAIDIPQNERTEITHGDITYIFEKDSGAKEVELISNGIEINDNRLTTIIQGGELIITYLEFDSNYNLTFESSVPQILTYKYNIDGKRHYFQDSLGIHVDKYRIGTDLVNISLIPASNSENNIVVNEIERVSWGQRNVFFVVFNEDTVVFVENLQLTIFLCILALTLLIIIFRRRK